MPILVQIKEVLLYGNWHKTVRPILHRFFQEHVLFYVYRWIAWGVAVASVILAEPTIESLREQPLYIWLLILTACITMAATVLARSYVQIARRFPIILSVDVMFGILLMLMSNGDILPFLPYALGAIILPALLFGWVGALAAGIGFTLLDQAGMAVSGITDTETGLIVRFAVPVTFVFGSMGLAWLASKARYLSNHNAYHPAPPEPFKPYTHQEMSNHPEPFMIPQPPPRRADEKRLPTMPATLPRHPLPGTSLSSSHPFSRHEKHEKHEEHENDDLSRVIHQFTLDTSIDLSHALEQLVKQANIHSTVELHIQVQGHVKHISPVQYVTLFKLAQEALLNIEQHAQAHSATLTLRYEPHSVTLTVKDDGVGLLDGTYKRPGVHSLRAIQYRLAEIDGSLEVFDQDGVIVRGIIPLFEYSTPSRKE